MRAILLIATLMVSSAAFGVTTSEFTHSQPEDFERGVFHQTVVSSNGDLRLSRSTTRLLDEDARFSITQALLPLPDGSVLLGTGPDALAIKLADSKAGEFFKAPDAAMCTALALADNPERDVLAGFSGESASVYRINRTTGKAQKIFQSPSLQFIWSICPLPDGSVLLGTGSTGELIKLTPEGKSRILLATKQHNILCITPMGNDQVAIGTDPDGLVIRVNTNTGEWFAMYDSQEPEITAIVADAAGNLYAAGSAVTETAEQPAAAAKPGRPEISPDIPLRRESPAPPQPPQLPDPTPGEPEPIPKAPRGSSEGGNGRGTEGRRHEGTEGLRLCYGPVRPILCAAESVEMPGRSAATSQPTSSPASTVARTPAVEEGTGNGSAVYRIARSGIVSELFRKQVTIHSLLMQKDMLIIGTGPEGIVYELRPSSRETAQIARSESRQVSAMTLDKDGRVLLGLSNPSGLLRMDAGYATSGTYTSEILDAQQVATFGKLQLQGTLGAGSTMTVSTRSGNVQDPETGGWSKWSAEAPAAEFLQISSPAARFLQYRLTLGTKDPASTAMVEQITLHYVLSNMAPKIESLRVEPEALESQDGAPKASPATHSIAWEASDPNNDALVYALHYRMGYRGQWVLLKDKLKETSYQWNTRELADGRYQVRLTAGDSPSNTTGALETTRFSNPLIIDNTPPVIGDVKSQVEGNVATISMRVVDRTSIVARVAYALDSHDDWQGVPTSDMLYDSPDETVKLVVKELAPGQHQVTVRASDSKGNTAYETLLVTVEERK